MKEYIKLNNKFDPYAFVYKNIKEKETDINNNVILSLDFLKETGIYKFRFIKENGIGGTYEIKHTYHIRHDEFLILNLDYVVALFINGKFIIFDDDDRDINLVYDYYFHKRCDYFDHDILIDKIDNHIKFIRIL